MPSNLQTDENGHIKRGPGRPKGSPNKVNAVFRDTVTQLLSDNAENVGRWLQLVAEGDGTDSGKPDPAKALDLMAKLAEYAAPKLSRAEVSGPDGGPVNIEVIDIILRKPDEATG